MPPVTRRGLFRTTASSSATLTPLPRTPARGRATPAIYGTPVDLDESCAICISALSHKRLATLRPCNHQFHASCGIRWMETRASREAQTCPLCRTRTFALDDNGDSAPPPYPFGATGQPSRVVLVREEQPANLRWLIQETQKRITRCEELEKSARGSEEEFAADVRDEKALLETRRETLTRLMGEYERGEWEGHASAADAVAELRRRLQHVRLLQLEHLRQLVQAGSPPRPSRVVARAPARADEPQQLQPHRERPSMMVSRDPAAVRPQPAPLPRRVTPATADWSQFRPVTVGRAPHAARPTAAALQRVAARTAVVQPRVAPTAAAVNWSQNRPPTVARAPHAARPTAAVLLRAAAVEAQRAAASAARAAAAATRPTTTLRNRPAQPVQPAAATRRVPAAAAGPARRRRLAVSSTPRTSPRRQQSRALPEDARVQAASPPRGRDEDSPVFADAGAGADPPTVPATPRRSARIAAARAARAAGEVTARLEM